MDKQDQMERLKAQALTCPPCPNAKTRLRVVFGEGDVNAKAMLVGQGPGVYEEQMGRPFVGPAGTLLNQALDEVGLVRDQLWLTNVIKCRAVRQEKGRLVDRAPSAAELKACRPWLEGELAIVQPRIVVCIGVPSAHALIDKKFKISEEHGQFRDGPDGRRLMAVFHPAYVLRLRSVDEEAYRRTRQALLTDLGQVAQALKEMA
jgi:uracil-DNA glycosylase family protein